MILQGGVRVQVKLIASEVMDYFQRKTFVAWALGQVKPNKNELLISEGFDVSTHTINECYFSRVSSSVSLVSFIQAQPLILICDITWRCSGFRG